jgi:branched-subunit amino acid ABC-type transport system permease component
MVPLAGFNLIPGFTVFGLTNGGTYALLAIGLVLIYRVSGVLNFAHGAVAMFATFCAYQVSTKWGAPPVVGLLVAVVVGCALGYVIERFTIRPLAGRSALVRTIVTVGWLLALQQAAGIIWGANAYHQPVKVVPLSHLFTAPGNAPVATDQFLTFVMAIALALGLAAALRLTPIGAQVRAVADDPVAARLWGINVNRVSSLSWVVGSGLAAVAGVLLTPRLNFDTISLTLLVIEGLIAAVIGGLSSLPLTIVGAFVLGVAEEWPRAFVTGNPGISNFVAVLVVVVILVARPPKFAGARTA